MCTPLVTSNGGGSTYKLMGIVLASNVQNKSLIIQFTDAAGAAVDLNAADILNLQICLSASTANP